jgi:hypothetical protein
MISAALTFTLYSGEPWVIDARDVREVRAFTHPGMVGCTLVDCGRLAYVVKESPISVKLRLFRWLPRADAAPTTDGRVYHA